MLLNELRKEVRGSTRPIIDINLLENILLEKQGYFCLEVKN